MSKIAVVYWSATGNTEMMAEAVAEGAREAGADVDVLAAAEFPPEKLDEYDAIAFGCPAMGDEMLEEDEFEPMFAACEPKLKGKRIAIFGSFGWGDGQWIRDWEERCKKSGADMPSGYLMLNGTPNADGKDECKALGKSLV